MPEAIPNWKQDQYYCISLPNGMHVKVAAKDKILHVRVVTKKGKEVHFIDKLDSPGAGPTVHYPAEAKRSAGTPVGGVKRWDLTLDSEVMSYDEEGSRP